MPIRKKIGLVIREAIAGLAPLDAAELDEFSTVDFGREAGHGDLTTPVAMRLARKTRQNPRALAEPIAEAIRNANERLGGAIERIEIAGPGFLNIFLARPYWLGVIRQVLAEGPRYGRSDIGQRRKVQLEFASANPTGPPSVAHARQAAIGDVLANILEFIGFDVTKEYWINDCGNQIVKLGDSVYVRYMEALGDTSIPFPEDGYHGEYVREVAAEIAHQDGRRYAEMARADAAAALGRRTADLLLQRILADYKRFGLEYDSMFSQREFESKGHIERLLERMKSLALTFERDGAVWMRTSDHGDTEDRVLVRSDGAWTYRLSDIAYHEDKFARGFELIIDMLGPDHHAHTVTMQAAMRALGRPVEAVRFLIVQHCTLIRGGDKIKMGKRLGQMVTLDEVIREVGTDAARFFFLLRKTDSHLDFDLELAKQQSLDNPVYYVQYAHARIASILRKAVETGRLGRDELANNLYGGRPEDDLGLLEDGDIALARQLARFGSVLERAGIDLEPHRLPNYLQELATAFHLYYTQQPVLGENEGLARARLQLVSAVRVVLRNALRIMGVHVPETM